MRNFFMLICVCFLAVSCTVPEESLQMGDSNVVSITAGNASEFTSSTNSTITDDLLNRNEISNEEMEQIDAFAQETGKNRVLSSNCPSIVAPTIYVNTSYTCFSAVCWSNFPVASQNVTQHISYWYHNGTNWVKVKEDNKFIFNVAAGVRWYAKLDNTCVNQAYVLHRIVSSVKTDTCTASVWSVNFTSLANINGIIVQ